MLIIGHRGAAGLAPENTLEALKAGFDAGADILEFDVRLTKDKVPILAHDAMYAGMWISRHTVKELKARMHVTTLKEVLDSYFGKILLNIELKQQDDQNPVYNLVQTYIKQPSDWEDVIFSSFKPRALLQLQQRNSHINLALLHHVNPFTFMHYHKRLNLSAVGFHRLHVNSLALAVAQKLGIFTYVYTVDNPKTAIRLARRGLDGLVTNRPDTIVDCLMDS